MDKARCNLENTDGLSGHVGKEFGDACLKEFIECAAERIIIKIISFEIGGNHRAIASKSVE
jgi:hypothetical protein